MADQGLITYPGVVQAVKCRYTRSTGTQPGHAILEYLPQGGNIAASGTLEFSYGGDTVTLLNCRVDVATLLGDSEAGYTSVVKIWDRRWAWYAGGEISGAYNLRSQYSGNLETDTEKNPRELAALLLDAMGETGYDVSALPTVDRPTVEWDYSHPATELERLCEQFGVLICLKIDTDVVVLETPGVGAVLSTTDSYSLAYAVDVEETPDSVRVVGFPVRFQSKLKLRAVGKELDGQILPINDLSYKPAAGWGIADNNFLVVTNETARRYARESVFKWYQVYAQADLTQNVPGYGDVVLIENILPLDGTKLNTYHDDPISGLERADEAFIEGEWFDTQTDTQGLVAPFSLFNGDFVLDREVGLVKIFGEQLYRDGLIRREADLYLTAAYYILDPVFRTRVRYVNLRNLGGTNGTGPFVVKRDDIKLQYTALYTGATPTGTTSNLTEVDAQAEAQLDATVAGYVNDEAYDAKYNGLKLIEIDGLIRQVTFKMDSRDTSERGGCETCVSLNTESDPYVDRRGTRRIKREVARPKVRSRVRGSRGTSET